MNLRGVLASAGLLLLSLCLFTCFHWLGVTRTSIMQLTVPRGVGTYSFIEPVDQYVLGIRWGVMYRFGWSDQMNTTVRPPGSLSKITGRGIVHPIEMPYDTCLGFSLRGRDHLYIGHGPYGLGQWSFPIWPLAVALLLPQARATWRRFRQRKANRANLCRACGYDLRASPDRCPECGTPSLPARMRLDDPQPPAPSRAARGII